MPGIGIFLFALLAAFCQPGNGNTSEERSKTRVLDLSRGAYISSEECGTCHRAIYREYSMGFGGDIEQAETADRSIDGDSVALSSHVSNAGTGHSLAGADTFPGHAREVEMGGESCSVCHFPMYFEIPDLDRPETGRPRPRPPGREAGGVTCTGCHLTPDGKIRGPYRVEAPHETVADPRIQTSAMCAYCHSLGRRQVGKQTQTFLEWRDDFHRPGLGIQHCQDCHMPRTIRKTAEEYNVPNRAVARHIWTGGHSKQRVSGALSVVMVQPDEGKPDLQIHIINIGAGHSVPTGSTRRGLFVFAEALDDTGKILRSREWLLAPTLEDHSDTRRPPPDDTAIQQASAAGSQHESGLRAGEERILKWTPDLATGSYTVRTRLVYDLNRFNDRSLSEDQTEATVTSTRIRVR